MRSKILIISSFRSNLSKLSRCVDGLSYNCRSFLRRDSVSSNVGHRDAELPAAVFKIARRGYSRSGGMALITDRYRCSVNPSSVISLALVTVATVGSWKAAEMA